MDVSIFNEFNRHIRKKLETVKVKLNFHASNDCTNQTALYYTIVPSTAFDEANMHASLIRLTSSTFGHPTLLVSPITWYSAVYLLMDKVVA